MSKNDQLLIEDWQEFRDFIAHRLVAHNREHGTADHGSKRLAEQLQRIDAHLTRHHQS